MLWHFQLDALALPKRVQDVNEKHFPPMGSAGSMGVIDLNFFSLFIKLIFTASYLG